MAPPDLIVCRDAHRIRSHSSQERQRTLMSIPAELLLLAGFPLLVVVALFVGHLVTLRGLRGDQRITVFRIFTEAVRRRR